jgi:hypothetical protein
MPVKIAIDKSGANKAAAESFNIERRRRKKKKIFLRQMIRRVQMADSQNLTHSEQFYSLAGSSRFKTRLRLTQKQ